MGVPKFFRYISERYPCLSEVVSEYQLPEFDNLYLDMNGIIHVCSHPNDTDPHFRITEEKIFRDIFHYIETLFRMIQPQKLFFMAVDGVAPRAKMNQQRGRRFRSAKDAEMAEARAQLRGEKLPDAERFDSNCITPGTEFMTRLQLQLKYFVTFKISTDKLWQKTKVILSGHETPGEGEHKIMDYIRYMKSQPNYDPNTRHCLYGLDADLIMLGLCTHEPHFSLLREEVKYVKSKSQKRIPTPEETTFFLLHLSLMREYLDLEFQQVKTTLPFPYDLEHIIDDWVLMGFLVGNDFIPHLPDLHINKGALQILYRTYMDVLPTLGGYINEGGTLRLDRFQKYMEKLAAFDLEQFKEFSADLRFFESKTGRKMGESKERHSYKNSEEPLTPPKNKDLAALIAATEEILDGSEEDDDDENYVDIDSDEEEDEDGICYAEFSAHKNNYYMEKLEYDKVTPEVLRSQGEGYVRAIQWNLNYYYNGCCSWSWFYPHHYAPYISDIKNFSDLKLEYDLGKPFLPFQQLLAVLPAASKKLLPSAYHNLMEGDDSPILDFYPTDFKTDLNGKRQDWEAVVLIPFIDQACLLKAMETKENELTEEEKKRNKHGPMHIYTYTPESQGVYPAPAYFPALDNHHAKVEEVFREQLYVEPSKLVKGLCPGVKLDVYYSGFPTLKHIPFKAALEKAKVKVFETNSLGDNMILTILPQGHPDVKEVATQLLGKSIYVNWPHMFEARVVAVSNTKARFGLKPEDDSIVQQDMTKAMQDQWELACKGIEEKYLSRMGINVGKTEILVYACSLEDKKYVLVDDKMRCEKQWARYPIAYALQTTRTNIAVYEPEPDAMMTIEKLFPPGKIVFTLDQQHYGSKAEVLEIVKNKRVKVCVTIESEPNIEEVQQNSRRLGPQYQSGVSLANRIGVSGHLISRITGTILILTGDIEDTDTRHRKLNIGLNLKFNKRNEEVCGYTKRGHTGYWLYSSKAEQEIADYKERFPEVFNYLTEKTGSDDIRDTDLYPEDTANKLKELGDWLKERESNHTERQKCGAQTLSEEVVKALEEVIDNHNKDVKETKPTVISYAKPSNLYVPKPKLGQAPDSKVVHYQLFDRVVNVRECHTVPLGYKGTIIGIHNGDSSTGKEQQTMYDILFDKEFTGGLKIRCSPNRGYRLQSQALINLSHGLRGDSSRAQGKPTAVVEPSSGVEDESSSWNNNAHNSAFVNWRDRPKHDTEGLQPQRVIEGSRSARGVEGGRSAPRNVDGGRSGQREFSWVNFQNRQQPQNPPFQSAPHQLSNEYLAMFKQLQKTGSSGKGPMPARGGGVDPITDSARALKNMLKIKTPEYSGKPQPSAQPLISHSPKKPLQSNHSYCSELLSFHQKYGIKLPRYLYMDTPDSLILSTVLCGNGLEFRGEPAHSNESAAESAAYKALQHLMGGAEDHKRGAAPYHTPNHPLLIPQRPSFPMSQRMGSNWRGGPEQFPPPPPNNWFQNNFKPGWLGNSNRASHPNFFSSPQVPRYQPPPQGPMSLPFQGNGGSFQQGPQWQQPRQFIPPQAESRFRQLQTPREPPREVQQRPSEQRPPTEPPVRQPPSSAPPPASQRLRRSRIAAKFNNPLSPM